MSATNIASLVISGAAILISIATIRNLRRGNRAAVRLNQQKEK